MKIIKNSFTVALLATVVMFTSCQNDSADNGVVRESNFTVIPQTSKKVTYRLDEADVQGIHGFITLREAGQQGIEAFIKLENTIPGVMHPVHIHEGLFGQGGDKAKSLNPINGTTGISQTFFTTLDDGTPTTYDDLVTNHEYYVGPHYSANQLETIIAKGDIGVNNPPIQCAPCDGKVNRLVFQYNGTQSATVSVIQKDGNVTLFNNTLLPGAQFAVDGRDRKGTLSTEIYVAVNGNQVAKIHTSCSVPIGPGYAFGDFVIVDGTSRNGGPLCDLVPSDVPAPCNTCVGKVNYLALEYTGDQTVNLKLVQNQGEIVFNGTVENGQVITINGVDRKGTLSSNVSVFINGVRKENIHTSCSIPIGVGSVFGALEVVDGSSRNGGPLCDI
jgi:hypothetical protein